MENQRMQKGNMAARNNRAMQSSEVFIRLDISMLNSYDMMLVREKYGIEGWGVVVFIMKYLIERRTDCRAPLYAVNEIARSLSWSFLHSLKLKPTESYFLVRIYCSFSAILLQMKSK